MKTTLASLILLVAVSCTVASTMFANPSVFPIPNEYIVTFREVSTHSERISVQSELLSAFPGTKILREFSIGSFKGFGFRGSKEAGVAMQSHPAIKMFSFNMQVRALQNDICYIQRDATWGINRVNERKPVLDGTYDFDKNGFGVDAYIIDTGILTSHAEFLGPSGPRAIWGVNYADFTNADCNGHGTHVAGTVGGNIYGLAKNVTLFAVKVLDCAGSGNLLGVIAGMDWAAQSAMTRKRPSVANMSLGALYNPLVNEAVTALKSAGVTVVVAAGNSDMDACWASPASSPDAVTVAATAFVTNGAGNQDDRASFSNFGSCVHIAAPGYQITSAWIGSNTAVRTISGTSMASPHVCGIAALYLGKNPAATPEAVKEFLVTSATPDVLNLQCGGDATCEATPNKLAFANCGAK